MVALISVGRKEAAALLRGRLYRIARHFSSLSPILRAYAMLISLFFCVYQGHGSLAWRDNYENEWPFSANVNICS